MGLTKKNTKKDKPLCQCPANKNEEPCTNPAITGKLFCKMHLNCKPAPVNGSEPKYIPEILNKSKAYLDTHNCLSYAIRGNKINMELLRQCKNTDGCNVNFEQPGAASGERTSKAMRNETMRTCPIVKNLTKSDIPNDFKESSFYAKCPSGMSKVALVVDEGTDYHWYRQNPDGTWSHKDGSNPVKDFDAKKQKIFNPKQASRDYGKDLNYEDFCGFFCVDRTKKIKLKQGGNRKTRSISNMGRNLATMIGKTAGTFIGRMTMKNKRK